MSFRAFCRFKLLALRSLVDFLRSSENFCHDLNQFLCCYTYLELHLGFVSNDDLDPDLSFDLDDGIDVFKHDFNCELNLDFDVDHDLDIDLKLVHDYDIQPNVDLG